MAYLNNTIISGDLKVLNDSKLNGAFFSNPVIIRSDTYNNYTEGLRINKSANNWAGITIGSNTGSTSGAPSASGGWFIAQDASNRFLINNTDSSTGNASIWVNTDKTVTINGTLNLVKNTDADGTKDNKPALIVGGVSTAKHIEICSDELMAKATGTTTGTLYLNNQGGTVNIGNATYGVCVNSSNSIYPRTTKKTSCGHSSYLWTTVYAQTATINTSDERQKQQIQDIPDEVLDAWEEVEFKQYKLNDSVAEKGNEKARIHIGLIAQNIMEVFEKHGLDPTKYGLFCHDEWDVHEDPEDETSPIIRHEDSYALRYEEALCLEAACDRRFRKRVMELLNKQSN